MKTRYYFAIIVLAGTICSNVASASTNRHAKKSRRARYNSVKAPSRSLAATKVKNVEFAFNKEDVPSEYYPELDNVAKLMTSNKASLKVSGYADNKGGYVYNWKLSEKRAKAVKSYLAGKGADTSRIATTEFGYTHPIASNKTPAGRKKNRRVEIHFAE
jgi:outer membrane protein OmpA-like peptidoglycan-associated protein